MQADYCTCSRAEGLALRSLPTARRCAGPDTCFNGGAASLVPPPLGHYLFVKGGGMAYPTKAGAGIGGWDTVVKGGTQVYKTPPFSGKYQARLLRRLRVCPGSCLTPARRARIGRGTNVFQYLGGRERRDTADACGADVRLQWQWQDNPNRSVQASRDGHCATVPGCELPPLLLRCARI